MANAGKGHDYPVEHFQENGFAFSPVISKEQSARALEQIKECWKQLDSQQLQIQGNDRFKIHLFLSEVNQIVHHANLLNAVRKALGTPHVALWSSDLNIKQPNSNQYFSAHQDATYTGLQPAQQCLTVWVALSDPVGLQEGCMSFLKRSHVLGQLPHVEELETTTSNMLSRGQKAVWEEKEGDEWVAVPLRAGEATFHQFHTIHKSGNNQHPSQPRVGLALRYMACTVRQIGPTREFITWIDSDTNDNDQMKEKMKQFFDLEPSLTANPTPEQVGIGREAHVEAMQRESSNYFLNSHNVKAYEK